MKQPTEYHTGHSLTVEPVYDDCTLPTDDSVVHLLQLILAGAPLHEVLTMLAQLVESRRSGTLCTIWLPDEAGKTVSCVAAPSLPGFSAHVGSMAISPRGGSCGTALYRREPVFVSDILTDPIWDDYRDRMLPYGIRAVWSRPLFASDGKTLGTFAILYREVRTPSAEDLQLIENAGHIAGIAIERHLNEQILRHERDRLRLLLEITNSMTSKLDFRGLVSALSTSLLRVTRCDFCALLLPQANHRHLRATILYNPEARGAIPEGAIIPMDGSVCGKAFQSGENQTIGSLEELPDTLQGLGSEEGQQFYQQIVEEGLRSGCDLALAGRNGVVGVLSAFSRSEHAFAECDRVFLEQLARQVAIAVENALDFETATEEKNRETERRLYLEQEILAEFGDIIGSSPALKNSLRMVSIVAPTDSSVLILGETGTGKELIARATHKLSSRRERAFVRLNCAAIPLGLLESELFGHEKGAFTGAITQKIGRFELAHKGTLFLDEVGDIPLELQAKLLRVVQEQEFERLGSNRTHKVDVRLIAATHRDLASMVKHSTFREDLYYRLKVFPIHIPALRQRSEDIPDLVWHFTQLFSRRMNKPIKHIPDETMAALVRYRWPGNIRELQNFVERAVILSPDSVLRAPVAELETFQPQAEDAAVISRLAELERDHIVRALEVSKWIVGGPNGAAERLGMKRTSLLYRMQKLGIERRTERDRKQATSPQTVKL